MIIWRLRGNIIRTVLCWIVWHSVHSPQHTYVSSSYRFDRFGLSHWDPYAVRRGGCLELYYCNMMEWYWWYSSLISMTNWFPSVIWHCWFGHLACKIVPQMTYNVLSGTLSLYTTTTIHLSVWRRQKNSVAFVGFVRVQHSCRLFNESSLKQMPTPFLKTLCAYLCITCSNI